MASDLARKTLLDVERNHRRYRVAMDEDDDSLAVVPSDVDDGIHDTYGQEGVLGGWL